jgi:hypothetical protein
LEKTEVQNIVNKIYPKIKKHYGLSDFYSEFPEVKLHHNIYARLTGIDEMEGDCDPDADFERGTNTIWIYWPKASSPRWIAETILHEYTHYLQDGEEMKEIKRSLKDAGGVVGIPSLGQFARKFSGK